MSLLYVYQNNFEKKTQLILFIISDFFFGGGAIGKPVVQILMQFKSIEYFYMHSVLYTNGVRNYNELILYTYF